MLALNGLPMLITRSSTCRALRALPGDRFFLVVFSSDVKYDPAATRQFLESLDPRSVSEGAKLRCSASANSWVRRCFLVVGMSAACRIDMHVQPRINPLAKSDFFYRPALRASPVEGTVARDQLHEDSYFLCRQDRQQPRRRHAFSGYERRSPTRGVERYNIYCAPCHSRLGDGNGFILREDHAQAAFFS